MPEYQDIYELESEICKNGKIDKRRTLYNFTKGNYYLAIGKTDSAKIFFYKLISPDLTANHHEAGYRGLYLLYKKIGQKDSLAKYADMCYQLNDASYASEATEKMQQMQALYNYTRSQKEANEMKAKADRNWLLLLVAIAVLLLVIAIASYFYQKRRKTKYSICNTKTPRIIWRRPKGTKGRWRKRTVACWKKRIRKSTRMSNRCVKLKHN